MGRQPKILVSAGEASGDLYASELVRALRNLYQEAVFFGCAGPRMRDAGVEPVIDAESLSVVGLVEVVHHLPRIYGEYRKLQAEIRRRRPDVAILTDSPDFHLRLARKLKKLGIPVVYLVAPQVWAWRKGRIPALRRDLKRLLCIFPFEPEFFAKHGVSATYIGHPLARLVRPSVDREAFFLKHGLDPSLRLLTLLPGSRIGEVARHLPVVVEAAERIRGRMPVNVVLATPKGFSRRAGETFFRERIPGRSIKVIEGETWDAIAHAGLALPASGTVTIETALLGTPMVTYYRVTGVSWLLGRFLVDVPFYSMVNLVAGRAVVPELMQRDFSAEKLAAQSIRLLEDETVRERMRRDLSEVAARLSSAGDPMERAAEIVAEIWNEQARES